MGPSGQLLDRVLKHHRIDRSKVFLSNACLCRPTNNDTPTTAAVERIEWQPPKYFVLDTEEEALWFLTFLRDSHVGPLAIDIETDIDREDPDHPNLYGMLCIGIGYAHKRVAVVGEAALTERVYRCLGIVLRQKELIGQGSKFDSAGLYPHCGHIPFTYDTMLASYAFDERPGIHDLGTQSIEFLGAPDWKHELDKYGAKKNGYGIVPRNVLYKYNAYDVSCTYDLWTMYDRKFNDPANEGLRRVHDLLMAASNQLVFVELNGMAVDRQYLRTLEVEYLRSIASVVDQINGVLRRSNALEREGTCDKKTGAHNPNSPLQVKQVLQAYRIRVESTDVSTLHAILAVIQGREGFDDCREYVSLLLQHRREAKLYGTYVKGIKQRLYRGRVYSSYRLHGTVTGRLASRNPNLQNIPRQSSIRRMFVPAREGNVYVNTDYSQAELRVLCYLAGDNYFRDIFNRGDRDLFDELTPILYPHADKLTMEPAAWKELRIRVKAYVYGLGYGREAGSVASEFGIPLEEARRGMQAFFGVIPEIVEFRERTRASVLAGKDLVTPFGRRRRFGLITKENRHEIMNEALAFIPQSTASDMCLQAFTWAREELRGVAFIRNLVHDSILAECRAEDAERVAGVLDRCMVESAQTIVADYVRFATDYKIGNNWGEV
jgi:DNA polymerase-1